MKIAQRLVKFCQIPNKPGKIAQILVQFYQSDEISTNLVSLLVPTCNLTVRPFASRSHFFKVIRVEDICPIWPHGIQSQEGSVCSMWPRWNSLGSSRIGEQPNRLNSKTFTGREIESQKRMLDSHYLFLKSAENKRKRGHVDKFSTAVRTISSQHTAENTHCWGKYHFYG